MSEGTPGVLLDRDGTLIQERHYLADPDGVELVPGAGAALRRLNQAGYPVALVTNQSGVARGLISREDVDRVHARLEKLLADEGAHLDGIWVCPHHPEHGGSCSCRKPSPGLAEEAARALHLDLHRSFVVGDKLCDVELARGVGASPILVRTGYGAAHADDHAEVLAGVAIVDDLSQAVQKILEAGR
jgi:histidinol-phosphate phosphatase family protein